MSFPLNPEGIVRMVLKNIIILIAFRLKACIVAKSHIHYQ